jgi:serine protease Do
MVRTSEIFEGQQKYVKRPRCVCSRWSLWLVFFPPLALFLAIGASAASDNSTRNDLHTVARRVQPKIVKLYGTGGLRGLEAHQSGILVSAEGHVLTVWSYVLDGDEVTVVLDDGRRFEAQLVAADPLTEIALLKFDPGKDPLPYFNLSESPTSEPGARVLAFSNLFGIATGDEPVSMLQGVVSAVAPLEARRGAQETPYRGDVYVVDAAANNPGAAGGALTDSQGRLLGMLGKELRSNVTSTWLNYALPTSAFAKTVDEMIAGKFTPPAIEDIDRPDNPLSIAALGIVLVPEVVSRTPPYVDRVAANSPAARAGLRADDLVVMIDSHVTASCREAIELIARRERDAEVRISVLRNGAFLELKLRAESPPQELGKEDDQ